MSYQPAPHLCGTIRGASDACSYLMITGREPVRDPAAAAAGADAEGELQPLRQAQIRRVIHHRKGDKKMSDMINILRMRPGEEPEEICVDNTLAALQAEVGGHIETVFADRDVRGRGVLAIVNEEGRLEELAPNCLLHGELIFGPILLVGVRGEDFCSIPEDYEPLWIDALERARERALPLIREWDRGI